MNFRVNDIFEINDHFSFNFINPLWVSKDSRNAYIIINRKRLIKYSHMQSMKSGRFRVTYRILYFNDVALAMIYLIAYGNK